MAILLLLWALATSAQNNYKILYSFKGQADGGGVFAGVALDAKGNLYGVTSGGGAYGSGTAFELIRSSSDHWNKTIIHNFCHPQECNDGSLPMDTPVLDSKGNLYDDSSAGIFQMTPGPHGWSFKLIHSYFGPEGRLPPENEPGIGDLLLDTAGNLYGTFGLGKNYNGAIAELSPGTYRWKEKNLYDFCLHPRNGVCLGGYLPGYRLAWDSAGNLYGVTLAGGVTRGGVAFQLEHTTHGWKEHVLLNFRPSGGYFPYAGPIVDQAGNVYGTTLQGGGGGGCGPTGCGTVYKLSKGKDGRWTETIPYNFPYYPKNGGGPAAPVTLDKAGNIYGTTSGGGDPTCSCGVVFKLTPGDGGKWTYQILHRFTGEDGWVPQAGLIFDNDYKHLYGTTTEGGPAGYGVVFEITP